MIESYPTPLVFRICNYLNKYSARSDHIQDRKELRNMGILLPIHEKSANYFFKKLNVSGAKFVEKSDISKLDRYRVTKIVSEVNRLNYFNVSENVKKEYLVLERINKLHLVKKELTHDFCLGAIYVPLRLEMFEKNCKVEKESKPQSMNYVVWKTIKNIERDVISNDLTEWDWCFRKIRDSFIGRNDDGWRNAFLRCKACLEEKL